MMVEWLVMRVYVENLYLVITALSRLLELIIINDFI